MDFPGRKVKEAFLFCAVTENIARQTTARRIHPVIPVAPKRHC
jgi:hypothetical protein